jgi:phytol kinase
MNYRWTITSLSIVICAYMYCEYRRVSGVSIPVISKITSYASRKRDEGRFVLGPLTMALGVLFTLLLFPPEAACVGIFALAFGDGIASLAGKMFGRVRIPGTGGKTVEGSTACFLAVYVSTLAVCRDPLKALAISFVAVIIEVLPIRDYDNLLIPVSIGFLEYLLP